MACNRIRDGTPGFLHQRDAGGPACDGERIACSHFVRRQEFVHRMGVTLSQR
jgi:hypothetical protein